MPVADSGLLHWLNITSIKHQVMSSYRGQQNGKVCKDYRYYHLLFHQLMLPSFAPTVQLSDLLPAPVSHVVESLSVNVISLNR